MSLAKSPSILCIVQLPPPIHGASVMNNYVINSKIINQTFRLNVISLKFVKSVKEVARFSVLKVFKAIGYSLEIVKKVRTTKPDLIYFTISIKGYAFYRDAFYVFLLKILKQKIVFHLHKKLYI